MIRRSPIAPQPTPEWDLVGLLGKLRLRKGQPHSPCWLLMRSISPEVEEWLLR